MRVSSLPTTELSGRLGLSAWERSAFFWRMALELAHGRRRSPGSRRTSRFPTPGSALRFWLSPPAGSWPCRSPVFSRIVSQRAGVDRRWIGVRRRDRGDWFWLLARDPVRDCVPGGNDERCHGRRDERQCERHRTPWGRPLMSSFHAAFSLGGAAGALLGGWLGATTGTALGLLGPALLSSLARRRRGSVPHA